MSALRWSRRVYGWLLRLLPVELRNEFGDDMDALFESRLDEAAGLRGRAHVWRFAVGDVVAVAIGERLGGTERTGVDGAMRSGAFGGLGFDFRYAMRTLARTPSYALATVVTLAVGIGSVTALFSVVNGVLLRPLPYRDADRLVLINSPFVTSDNVEEFRGRVSGAEASGVFSIARETLVMPDGATQVFVMPVGRGLLDVLGWRTVAGRAFTESDHASNGPRVALVSERFRRQRFGDTDVVGRTLRLDDRVYEVVGVLPRDELLGYAGIDVWIPYETSGARSASLIARLPEGVAVDAVRGELQPVADALATPEMRRRYEGMRVTTLTMHRFDDIVVGDARSTLWILFAASGLVLLLSALNVANLAAGRAQGRACELALRAALGASRFRLMRQLVAEAMLVAAGGVVLGLLLAATTPELLALAPDYLPRAAEIRMDARVMAWAILVTMATVLAIGVAPGWWIARRGERASLHAAVERVRHRGAGRSTLVVVEIAVALVLVVGVALLGRTYAALRPTAPGFRMDDRVAATFNLPRPRYDDPSAARRFAEDVVAGIKLGTGADAAITTDLPLTGMSAFLQATRGGPDGERTGVHYRAVSTDYLELMEMPMVTGRSLTEVDARSDIVPIVVNETAARTLWESTERATGRRTTLELRDGPVTAEVVGVVRDAWALRGPEAAPEVFAPFDRLPSARFRIVAASTAARAVRERDVTAAVNAVDPGVPVLEFSTMRELAAWTTVVPRFQATLLGILSLIALLLAATGCFAVLSQMVAQRRRELGIRVALGARAASIAGLVLRRVLLLATIGVVLGAAGALASTRVLASELYGVTASDPATYIASVAVLIVTVVAAAARPLWRALRVDPMTSLRES